LIDPGNIQNWSYATINGNTAYPDPTLDIIWTVSAVPVPSSYILMLSGLGLLSSGGRLKPLAKYETKSCVTYDKVASGETAAFPGSPFSFEQYVRSWPYPDI
jgi:hypothetical protein